LNEAKKRQIIALGRLGGSLRRIQQSTEVRRETAAAYLREAGIAVRPPGAWGRAAPAKPANEVTPDPVGATQAEGTSAEPPHAKPANEVTTDFGVELEELPTPVRLDRGPSASSCEVHRDAIEMGLARGRNAKAIWQDLVDVYSFAGDYQSVKHFVRRLRGKRTAEARVVIVGWSLRSSASLAQRFSSARTRRADGRVSFISLSV
jgi:hypothetical protein